MAGSISPTGDGAATAAYSAGGWVSLFCLAGHSVSERPEFISNHRGNWLRGRDRGGVPLGDPWVIQLTSMPCICSIVDIASRVGDRGEPATKGLSKDVCFEGQVAQCPEVVGVERPTGFIGGVPS